MTEPAPQVPPANPIRKQLVDEHALLDRALKDISCAADGGEACDVRRAWGELEELLVRHLDFEEKELFPRLEALHPEWTAGFRRDHAVIRRLLAELGIRVDLHALRKQEIDELVDALREHAEREDATVYRWAGESAPIDTRRHLLALLVKTAAGRHGSSLTPPHQS
jgi:hypothetical protein